MEYALGLLIFWILLFYPIGLGFHWLVLGASARTYALPMGLVSGTAIGVVALGALRQANLDIGTPVVPLVFLVASVATAAVVKRREGALFARSVIGPVVLVVFTLTLGGMAVIERADVESLRGPVAYGTGNEPVESVATMDAELQRGAATRAAIKRARDSADERYTGFEVLGAMTVAAGDTADVDKSKWSAYVLYVPLLVVLMAMTSLPLVVLGRWRNMRWYGQLLTAIVGVAAPTVILGMGLAHSAAVTAMPFVVAAVTAILISRRDRGWFAVAGVSACAALTVAGPLTLLPIVGTLVVWRVAQRRTREHLAQADKPVALERPVVAGVVLAMFTLFAVAGALLGGQLYTWEPLRHSVTDAVTSWPLSWLGEGLEIAGPDAPLDWMVAATGPLLLVLAIVRGFARSEAREKLSLVGGVVLASATGLAFAAFDRELAIATVELVLLVSTPLLALVCVRTVGSVRAEAAESESKIGRYALGGSLLTLAFFALASMSASAVSGQRTVSAPALSAAKLPSKSALIAVGDPWLSYELDGESSWGGAVDADRMASRGRFSSAALTSGEYDYVVLDTDPLSSDPAGRYNESTALSEHAARLFIDRPEFSLDAVAGASGVSADGGRLAYPLPRAHHAVESDDSTLGGALVPERQIDNCEVPLSGMCEPPGAVIEDDCTPQDRDALQARRRPKADSDKAENSTTVAGDEDSERDDKEDVPQPPLLGMACWTVPLEDVTKALAVHIRDVGLIMSPREAVFTGGRKSYEALHDNPLYPGDRLLTSAKDAIAEFGGGNLSGRFDMVVEGRFPAGVDIATDVGGDGASPVQSLPPSAGSFSRILREQSVYGSIRFVNSVGTDVSIGRGVLRPTTDLAPACDVILATKAAGERDGYPAVVSRITSTTSGTQEEDAFVIAVSGITTRGGVDGGKRQRLARLVLGNYMQSIGMPHSLLVDWVEQYGEPADRLETRDCTNASLLTDDLSSNLPRILYTVPSANDDDSAGGTSDTDAARSFGDPARAGRH